MKIKNKKRPEKLGTPSRFYKDPITFRSIRRVFRYESQRSVRGCSGSAAASKVLPPWTERRKA